MHSKHKEKSETTDDSTTISSERILVIEKEPIGTDKNQFSVSDDLKRTQKEWEEYDKMEETGEEAIEAVIIEQVIENRSNSLGIDDETNKSSDRFEEFIAKNPTSTNKKIVDIDEELEKKLKEKEETNKNEKMNADELKKELMSGFKRNENDKADVKEDSGKTETEVMLNEFEGEQREIAEKSFIEKMMDCLCCRTSNNHEN